MCDTWSADMTHLPLTPPSPLPRSAGLGSPLSSLCSCSRSLSLPTCSEVSWPVPPHAAQSPPLLQPADCRVSPSGARLIAPCSNPNSWHQAPSNLKLMYCNNDCLVKGLRVKDKRHIYHSVIQVFSCFLVSARIYRYI